MVVIPMADAERILLDLNTLVPALDRLGSKLAGKEFRDDSDALRTIVRALRSLQFVRKLSSIRRTIDAAYDQVASPRKKAALIRRINGKWPESL